MPTAIEVAERSLKLILVQASDAQLEADEYQDFYTAMNDYMADLEARGIVLGYTPVTLPSDEITIPSGAIRGLVTNMAIEVAPDYAAPVSGELQIQAMEGYRTLRRLGRSKISSVYSPGLPIGSGMVEVSAQTTPLYGQQVSVLLSLIGNTKATTITAADTPVKVNGFWDQSKSTLRADITGRVINSTDQAITLDSTSTVEVTGGVNFTLHLYKNGNESLGSVSGVANGAPVILQKSLTLHPDEHLELWIENDTDTTNLVVQDARLALS